MLRLESFATVTYIELQVFCLSILVYLFVSTINHNRRKGYKTSRNLIGLFVSCFLIILSDATWALLEYSKILPRWASYLVNEIYYISTSIAPFFWLIYQEEASESEISKNRNLFYVLFIPCLLHMLLAISAPLNHLCFYIDEAGEYQRGQFHIVSVLIGFIYLVGASMRAFYRAAFANSEMEQKLNRTLGFYPIPIILFGVLQAITGYAFNCIGFTVSLFIYYVGLLKGQEIQRLEMENRLVDDYDALFIVDGENDSIRSLRMSNEYRESQRRLDDQQRYSVRIEDGIRHNISAEYKKEAAEEFSVDTIIRKLKKQKYYYYDYCIINNRGELVHYRAKFEKAQELSRKSFILGIKNVEEEMKNELELERRKAEEERTLSIIKNLSNDFECLDYVEIHEDKSKDRVVSYRSSRELTNNIPGWDEETSISRRYDLLMNYCVDPSEKENFYSFTRREMILLHLKKDPAYYIDFKVNFADGNHYYQLKYAIVNQDEKGNIKAFISGLKNIDKEVRVRHDLIKLEESYSQQKSFIKLFVDNYVSAYYVDLENNTFIIYKSDGVSSHFVSDNYEECINLYIDNYVLETDRDMMRKFCSLESVREAIRAKNETSVVYTDVADDAFYKMQIIKGADENHAAIAFLDVNDEYLKEQAIQKELERQVSERTSELSENNLRISRMNIGIMELMADMVESRDKESGEHVARVKDFTRVLATQIMNDYPEYELTEEKIVNITNASILHDVGKISIPDAILLKPEELTHEEMEIMKTHCERGCDFLQQLTDYWDPNYLKLSMDICLYHHEKWDGKGYPKGLKGDEIPIAAQIVAVADCFDALTSKRVYKDAIRAREALDMIENGKCGAFSEKILSALLKVEDIFISLVK